MSSLLKLPPLPRFDPEKDGNPFAWIVREAPKAKEARRAVLNGSTHAYRFPWTRPTRP